jgi:hypothetical protein
LFADKLAGTIENEDAVMHPLDTRFDGFDEPSAGEYVLPLQTAGIACG